MAGSENVVPFSRPTSGPDEEPTREKALALFTFLKELTELRSRTVRTVDQYPEVLWFTDVPGDRALCDCVIWRKEPEEQRDEVWLEIRKPRLVNPPDPGPELSPWILREQLEDSSLEMPELLEEIVVSSAERGESDPTETPSVEKRDIQDHPHVKKLWENYVEQQWWTWAERDRKLQEVQDAYTKLFSIQQRQQRLGEQYEVIVGLGILAWKGPDGHEILRHLITAQTSVTFDATRGVITVGPAGEGAGLALEQDMLDPKFRPDPMELKAVEDQLAEIVDHEIWGGTQLEAVLAGWVHAASARGNFEKSLQCPQRVRGEPRVHMAPALILRRRNERSYIRAFAEILKQLQEGAEIPSGVSRFVVEGDSQGAAASGDGEGPSSDTGINEIYFPLPSNEQQDQIVQRLAVHDGVLVQGPPGTGKSHTIVNLVSHLLASGQRVLVTSHAARALRVLRRYIQEKVPAIAPLAVVLLGDDRESLQAMEDSVQGITERHNRWDPAANRKRIDELEKELDGARREEAQTLQELRAIREAETYEHPPLFDSYEGTLQAIAGSLRGEARRFEWFSDRPEETEEPALSQPELVELLGLLRDEALARYAPQGGSVGPEELLSAEQFSDLVSREVDARKRFDEAVVPRRHPAYRTLAKSEATEVDRVRDALTDLLLEADRISRHIQPWTESAVTAILGDRDRTWRELFRATRDHLEQIGDRANNLRPESVGGLKGRDHRVVKADAEALLSHLESGGRLGFGPFRAASVKQGLYFFKEVRVGGRLCKGRGELRQLISWLDVEERLDTLHRLWAPHARVTVGDFAAQVADYKDLCEPLAAALSLHDRLGEARDIIGGIRGLPEPTWHDLGAVRALKDAAAAVRLGSALEKATAELTTYDDALGSTLASTGNALVGDLTTALRSRQPEAYARGFGEIAEDYSLRRAGERKRALLDRLEAAAPKTAAAMAEAPHDQTWDERAAEFSLAWDWARARRWIRRLTDPEAEEQLRLRMSGARERTRNRLQAVAAVKAWSHCFERMTEHERQHLVAWSKAMRNVGKGTGKYAPVHRRAAREHMGECRTAIPAWVMPLYRVAETIRPGTDLFDVAIIDEASQSGPEALLLTYLAKKLVVVGDDKQIAPEFVGINREDVGQLRVRHIDSLPHSDQYGVDNSFFDLAEIRYQGRIRLREHFRCMPEIIQFSNGLCYRAEPLIPLRQYGARRLKPVVGTQFVGDGYLQGTGQRVNNPPEAEAIVEWIREACADQSYLGKTFGVISLLGYHQARRIEELLVETLGPEEIGRRQIVCGDAYAFQGDERDVVLLSLVSAPAEGRRIGVLTGARHERRFNVAASRARDQMLLFHSATFNDLSPKCLRHDLLKYCQNPAVNERKIGEVPIEDLRHQSLVADRRTFPPPDPFESWFEVDVFLQITDRGYRVVPQYEIAGYRVDLMVFGMQGRLAVECDGDFWHGPDRYADDVARQRVLERCGLRFCRIRGSAFELSSELALRELWDALDRLEIYPVGDEREEREEGESEGAHRGHDGKRDVGDGQATEQEPEGAAKEPKEAEPVQRGRESGFDRSWKARGVPDASTARLPDMLAWIDVIVREEGPLTAYRAMRIYVKASGRHRLSKMARVPLFRALRKALRDGLVEGRDEFENGELDDLILRAPGTPLVVVRPRGGRQFREIPPSEVAEVMKRVRQERPLRRGSDLYREVLAYFETKRLTEPIRRRLQWVEERINDLLG